MIKYPFFNKFRCLVMILFMLLASSHAFAIDINLKSNNGLFQVSGEDGILVTSKYVGWQKGWRWDWPDVKPAISQLEQKRYTLNFHNQGVRSVVDIERHNTQIEYTYRFNFNKSIPNTIGGGIEFNLDLKSQMRNHAAKEPKLLPDNKGWIWEFEPGKKIQVSFPNSVANVYFEQGNKSIIRVMLFSDKIMKGSKKTSMVIDVPRHSLKTFFNNNSESLHSFWLKKPLSPVDSFIDLSYLNHKPAGSHGYIKAIGDDFRYADGSKAIFFGTNVQAYSLFSNNKLLVKKHAKRIASLGFNLVRLTHTDTPWVVPSLISQGKTTQGINGKALDAYFWWVKCLRDEGIYISVDLQVERPWREGDQIPGWKTDMKSEAKNGMAGGKGFIYLNKRMQELTKKFNKELLTRINPYTQLALKDDPAVMGVMITNENDLTYHFGNTFLADKNHPYHQALFDKEVESFANKFGLPAYKVHETWKPGASKYLLNDIEARFNKDMIKHLRDLGVKVPITTTNLWGGESLYSLPALTTGDTVDAHGYADAGIYNKRQLQKNPNFDPYFLHWIGQGQVVDMPFTVTEYNVEQNSAEDDAYVPAISVASMAAFQDWDAIMLYGYSQDGLSSASASPWDSYMHPSILGVMPAMALLYREGHVRPANKTVVLNPINDELFEKNLSPLTSLSIRTSLEQHRMVVAMPKTNNLPWLQPSSIDKNATVIHDMNKSMLPVNQNYIISDTGEVKRDWKKGIMTINTPKSQLVMGRIGGGKIKLNDIIVDSKTPEAAIILTSLDKKSIRTSKSILVSAVAKVAKVRHQGKTTYISESVKAKISFSSIHKGLRLIALRPDGREGRSLPLKKDSRGDYSFILSEKDKTHWYMITK